MRSTARLIIPMLVLATAPFLWQCKVHRESPGEMTDVQRTLRDAGCMPAVADRLVAMGIDEREAEEIATMLQAGMSSTVALRIVEIERPRSGKFALGDVVRQARFAGTADAAVIELVKLGALPEWIDDLTQLRYAGMSDYTLIAIARMKYADHASVPTGSDLARLRAAGMADPSVLRAVRRGITAADIDMMCRERERGTSDERILDMLEHR